MPQETVKGPIPSQPPAYPSLIDTYDSAVALIAEYIPHIAYAAIPKTILAGSNMSCGVTMMSGLSQTPKAITDKVLKMRASTDRKKIREAFVTFSDVATFKETGNGEKLCQYIKDNNLGEISMLGPRMNPNSGNMIKIWIWAPAHENLDPSHRNMAVFGKKCIRGPYGDPVYIDASDERFKDPRFTALPGTT